MCVPVGYLDEYPVPIREYYTYCLTWVRKKVLKEIDTRLCTPYFLQSEQRVFHHLTQCNMNLLIK